MNGKWIIFWDSGTYSQRPCSYPKQVVKETEKLLKFSRSGSWPRQIDKSDLLATFDTEAEASEALDKAQATYKATYEKMSVAVNEANTMHQNAIAARRKAIIGAVAKAVIDAPDE